MTTTATTTAPAAAATEGGTTTTRTLCPGSGSYVAFAESNIISRSKKGRAAWALVSCPSCDALPMRAGVWFTEGGQVLNGTEGLAYLNRHFV